MARRKLGPWEAALSSAGYWDRETVRARWLKRSEASKRGWAKRKARAKRPDVPTVALEYGLEKAFDVAREWSIHPDEFARDISFDWDMPVHDVYEEYFYPEEGGGW